MNARWDVLGFGSVAVDDLIYVDQYLPPDTKIPIRDRQRQGGGLTGTALVAAARLGAKAAYCGVLGDDELSHFTRKELEREGVDCTLVSYRPDARSIYAIVIVDQSTGHRSILYSTDDVVEPEPEKITSELVTNSRVLFVDQTVIETALRVIELARVHGIPIVGDVESDSDPRAPDLIRQVDHLIVGAQLARRVGGARF